MIISTFSDDVSLEQLEFQVSFFRNPEKSAHYNSNENGIHQWLPPNDIWLEATFAVANWQKQYILSWYCPATHVRGYFEENKRTGDKGRLTGKIPGDAIRSRFELHLLETDEAGFISSTSPVQSFMIEGNASYFPTRQFDFGGDTNGAFCSIEIPDDIQPDEIFSQSTVLSQFNNKSGFYDAKEGQPVNGYAKYFGLYEIARQFIEVLLSKEDTFIEFMYSEEKDDLRVGVIWTALLNNIFTQMTLEEIRMLRKYDYARFCELIQHYLFNNVIISR